MDWQDRITVNPDIVLGKPAIRGTRIPVQLIVEFLSSGWSEKDILDSYPFIAREDILACLAYAAAVLDEERFSSLAARIQPAPMQVVEQVYSASVEVPA